MRPDIKRRWMSGGIPAARALATIAALGLAPGVPAESPAEVVEKHRLEIGIAPYLPVRILVRSYQPLRAHLEHELGEPVEIVTAPDYRSFHQRIDHREYPLVITVVNSAYLAYRDVGYVPMLQPLHATYPILVTLQSSAAHGLAELRGKSLALPDPLAVISMQALSLIGEAGLHAGRDIHLRHMPTHSAAVNHVLTGEVAAAIVSNRALQQMSQDVRGRVRVAQSWEQHAVPGIVYLASPRLSHERRTRLIDAIVAFTHSPKGRAMMQTFGYGELVPASARDLEAFAAYGSMLKAALAAPAGDASPAHPPP